MIKYDSVKYEDETMPRKRGPRRWTAACAVLAAGLCVSPPAALADEGPVVGERGIFGLGLIMGEPTGGTGKLFLGQRFAFQFSGAFWFYHGRDYMQAFVDFIWYPSVLTNNEWFVLPWYFGVGGGAGIRAPWEKARDEWRAAPRVDVRVPFGFSFLFHKLPMEAFVEFGPMLRVYEPVAFWGFFAVGGRWYFG